MSNNDNHNGPVPLPSNQADGHATVTASKRKYTRRDLQPVAGVKSSSKGAPGLSLEQVRADVSALVRLSVEGDVATALIVLIDRRLSVLE